MRRSNCFTDRLSFPDYPIKNNNGAKFVFRNNVHNNLFVINILDLNAILKLVLYEFKSFIFIVCKLVIHAGKNFKYILELDLT